MNLLPLSPLFLLSLALVAAAPDGTTARYAWVNTDRVLNETGLRDQITQAYQAELQGSNELLQDKQEELNQSITIFNDMVRSRTWDEARQEEEKKKIGQLQQEVENMRVVLERQLQQNAKERDSNTMVALISLINAVATENGYDWVFQVTNTLTPGVLMAPQKDDLTERVIEHVKKVMAEPEKESTGTE